MLDSPADSDSDTPDVDIPIPPAPRKQKARKSGKVALVIKTLDPTNRLQGPDPIEDNAASNEDSPDGIEQSSVTESDDDIVVIKHDDPFFEDPKNNSNKLSKKLSAEVCFRNSPSLSTAIYLL